MICPECNGRGETIYFVETDRDEYSVTMEQRKGICRTCNGSGEKPMTNADRIRAMSDEELADMCVHYNPETEMYTNDTGEYYFDFVSAMEDELEWLKQPAKGE